MLVHAIRITLTLCLATFAAGSGSLADGGEGLRSGDKWERKQAVEALARSGTEADWRLVAGALSDPRGEVADTAQLLLGRCPAELAQELLNSDSGLGSKTVAIRRRAAEVFGRLQGDVDAKGLLRRLRDRDEEVRRMLLYSLQRSIAGGRLAGADGRELRGALASRAKSERDAAVRVRALAALAALDPLAARELSNRALDDRDARVRTGCVGLVPRLLSDGGAEAALRAAFEDEAWSVRAAAIEACRELGSKTALELLIERLGREPERRSAWRTVEVLRELTGLRHGDDPRPWRDLVAGLADDWSAGASRATRYGGPADERSSAFAGLPLVSGRLAFLIDLSGSIWIERADGRTRKEVVDEELARAVAGLPEEARFNLIPFTSEPHPWRERLTAARPKAKREATAFLRSCDERGSGDFWEAAMLALEDPAVDTLVVLTDGAPTGGERYALELIVPLFVELNATRRVAVDSVLVGAGRRLQRYWTALADATGGTSRAIDLDG